MVPIHVVPLTRLLEAVSKAVTKMEKINLLTPAQDSRLPQ